MLTHEIVTALNTGDTYRLNGATGDFLIRRTPRGAIVTTKIGEMKVEHSWFVKNNLILPIFANINAYGLRRNINKFRAASSPFTA